MTRSELKNIFIDLIRDEFSNISKIVSASIFPPIAEGAEMVMRVIEKRIIRIEKRIMRKIYSLLIIGLGSMFLIFALLFFLIEYLSWSLTASFFFMGVLILAIGILLKFSE